MRQENKQINIDWGRKYSEEVELKRNTWQQKRKKINTRQEKRKGVKIIHSTDSRFFTASDNISHSKQALGAFS